jgi:hypothetical protein
MVCAGHLSSCVGPDQSHSPFVPSPSVPRIVVEAKLVRLTPIPDPRSVLPYRRAMVAHAYEVQKVVEGSCRDTRLLVARWAIRDGKALPVEWKTGDLHRLTLVRYADEPRLKSEKLVMDADAIDLPLYYAVEP